MSDFPEKDAHLNQLVRSVRENDGLTPLEADEALNGSARNLLRACLSRWEAVYVGIFNDYQRDRARDPARVLRRLKRDETICNFSADFAVPQNDAELVAAVLAFRESPTLDRIEAVSQRVKALGGVLLNWS